MVWLTTNDRACAIQLLREHEPGKLVRQRPRCQRQPDVRPIAETVVQPECTANHEDDVACSFPLALYPRRKTLGRHRLPARVAGNFRCDIADSRADAISLARAYTRRRAC